LGEEHLHRQLQEERFTIGAQVAVLDLGEAHVVALESVAFQIELAQRDLEFGKRDWRRAAHAVEA
jgi:hypothetical protein